MTLKMVLVRNPDGQLEGAVEVDQAHTVAFCGTLELLKVLEEAAEPKTLEGQL